MQLLQDVFIIEQLQVLNEGNQKDVMKIRGVFGRCNEKNNNGRVYPTAVVASQLEKVQPLIAERRLCGELDHPQNDTVKLSNASHLITKLDMKGDELIGEAEILKTPAGLTAKALVDGGVKIGISSRGMGTLSEDQNGDKIVNEDYRLVTFDLVADPSTRGAYPGLAESTESKFVRESQSKLKKEGTFVTLLNSKLRDAYQPWIEESKKKTSTPVKDKVLDHAVEEVNVRGPKYGEAFELIKADGHWHRIAEAIRGCLMEQESPKNKAISSDVLDKAKASIEKGNAASAQKWGSIARRRPQRVYQKPTDKERVQQKRGLIPTFFHKAGQMIQRRQDRGVARRAGEHFDKLVRKGKNPPLSSMLSKPEQDAFADLAAKDVQDKERKASDLAADRKSMAAELKHGRKKLPSRMDQVARQKAQEDLKKARAEGHAFLKTKYENSATAYKQIGMHLAEMLNLVEEKWMQKAAASMERRGTEGSFTKWCGGKVTDACIKRGLAEGGKIAKKAAFAKAARGSKK